jgi:acetone carboxylase gamma subunit
MRFHEYLEIVSKTDGQRVTRCIKCGHEFCNAADNYKKHTLLWERDAKEYPLRSPVSGETMFTRYQEYICPGCGTLLQVDVICPELDKDNPILWDIQLKL